MNGQRRSAAFKAKIVAAKNAGVNVSQLAAKYGLATSQIYKWSAVAGEAGSGIAAKGHRMKRTKRKLKRNPAADTSDVDRIVTELLSSMRPGLVKVIGKLVDLGVERKLDETRATVMNALRRAS